MKASRRFRRGGTRSRFSSVAIAARSTQNAVRNAVFVDYMKKSWWRDLLRAKGPKSGGVIGSLGYQAQVSFPRRGDEKRPRTKERYNNPMKGGRVGAAVACRGALQCAGKMTTRNGDERRENKRHERVDNNVFFPPPPSTTTSSHQTQTQLAAI